MWKEVWRLLLFSRATHIETLQYTCACARTRDWKYTHQTLARVVTNIVHGIVLFLLRCTRTFRRRLLHWTAARISDDFPRLWCAKKCCMMTMMASHTNYFESAVLFRVYECNERKRWTYFLGLCDGIWLIKSTASSIYDFVISCWGLIEFTCKRRKCWTQYTFNDVMFFFLVP